MLVFLIFFNFITIALTQLLPLKAAEIAAPFHQACVHFSPTSSQSENYLALVCGESPAHSAFKSRLASAGLLHLVIASGSHLLFLEAFLRATLSRQHRIIRALSWPLLLGFTLINRLEPRVLRAFLTLAFQRFADHHQLRWSRAQVITAAGISTLTFCQSDRQFTGLLMSWIASLAILLATCGFKRSARFTDSETAWLRWSRQLWLQSHLYVLMAPCLILLRLPNPMSILFNLLLGPPLGAILFPASLLAFLLPPLVGVVDLIWRMFESTLALLAFFLPAPFEAIDVPTGALVSYLLILTACAWHREHERLRCA